MYGTGSFSDILFATQQNDFVFASASCVLVSALCYNMPRIPARDGTDSPTSDEQLYEHISSSYLCTCCCHGRSSPWALTLLLQLLLLPLSHDAHLTIGLAQLQYALVSRLEVLTVNALRVKALPTSTTHCCTAAAVDTAKNRPYSCCCCCGSQMPRIQDDAPDCHLLRGGV